MRSILLKKRTKNFMNILFFNKNITIASPVIVVRLEKMTKQTKYHLENYMLLTTMTTTTFKLRKLK